MQGMSRLRSRSSLEKAQLHSFWKNLKKNFMKKGLQLKLFKRWTTAQKKFTHLSRDDKRDNHKKVMLTMI